MLSAGSDDLYDVRHDPAVAGALVTPGEAASITAVATQLRGEIYAGKYPAGEKAPSRQALADKHGISRESAGVVLRMLAGEGLVSLQQGSGTYVLPRYGFFAAVSVPRGSVARQDGERQRLAAAVKLAEAAEPAVSGADVLADAVRARIAMRVECADVARAVVIALAVVRAAARGSRWSWDGWDLDGASVEARPADSGN